MEKRTKSKYRRLHMSDRWWEEYERQAEYTSGVGLK